MYKVYRVSAIGIFVAHVVILAIEATYDSPILNEPAILVAGISHCQLGDFSLYRVNPPLTRMLAAMPVMLTGHHFEWPDLARYKGNRPTYSLAEQYLDQNKLSACRQIVLGRYVCIAFSVLGGVICFAWATDIFGSSAGIIALSLWCFSPLVLGNAHLITSDVPAATLCLTANYLYCVVCKRPGISQAAIAGLALGLAELTKFTALILLPIWLVNGIRLVILGRHVSERPMQIVMAHLVIAIIGILTINAGYCFKGVGFQPSDLPYKSSSFKSIFAPNMLLANMPWPLPVDYWLGIDEQKHDFEIGEQSFVMGKWCSEGHWSYYPYALFVKTPIGTVVLVFLFMVYSVRVLWHRDKGVGILVAFMLMLAAILLSSAKLQHARYALPLVPCICILASGVASVSIYMRYIVFVCVTLTAVSSLSIVPHSLSYVNEMTSARASDGGVLLHSDFDWGQDLGYLRRWADSYPVSRPLFPIYFGSVSPSIYMDGISIPEILADQPLPKGTYAVSATLLGGFPAKTPLGFDHWVRWPPFLFDELHRLKPIGRAGRSIIIFEVR